MLLSARLIISILHVQLVVYYESACRQKMLEYPLAKAESFIYLLHPV